MKLRQILDRACDQRMNARHRIRSGFLLLAAMMASLLLLTPVTASAAQVITAPTATNLETPAMAMGSLLVGGALMTGLIRDEQTDPQSGGDGGGGGGGSVKTDEINLTIGQRLSAAIASKADLQAKIAEREETIAGHQARVDQLTQANADLQAKFDAANAKVTKLEAEAAEVDQALKQAEAEAAAEKAKNSTIEKKSQEKVASLGFPASKLPAEQESDASAADVPSSREELEKAMAKCATHDERAKLLTQYRKAQSAAVAGQN